MAGKNVVRRIKIELDAGNAGPAELGKMLGPYGLNLREIMLRYNEATAGQRGDRVPVEVTVFEDRSYALRYLAPPTSFLLRRAAGPGPAASGLRSEATREDAAPKGPGPRERSERQEQGPVITGEQLREIALRKLPELNTDDLDAAMRTVAGTARSMGISVKS
jgi:large subunit ribosomal protein L11